MTRPRTPMAVRLAARYALAVAAPTALTVVVAWMQWPAFIFEHLALLLVVGLALPWGLGPSSVAAVTVVFVDNTLLREPIGVPAITGFRDAVDLLLFGVVAIVISALMARVQRERTAARAAAERERRAREERDRLIDTISHDLATPLQVISANLQFARQARVTELDLERLFSRVETATVRATSLVRTLADAKALDSDGLAVNLAPLDLRDVVAPVVHMFDRMSERHSVILAVPESPVIVQGDSDRLRRVVENLVSNGIKYSPHGGSVEVMLGIERDSAVLTVRDYGIGIAPADQARIFERNYRAQEASQYAAGLGLGLSIAAEIVARHRGHIHVTPTDPCGATFIVELPLAPTPARHRPERLSRS